MENKNKIIEKINITKEILSTFPKNNKKNMLMYLEEMTKTFNIYNELKIKVIDDFKSRNKRFDNLTKNKEIDITKNKLEQLKLKMTLLNDIKHPYEKTGLDKLIYNISKYYKGNLSKVNTDILNVIKIFEDVGIKLTKDDFFYSDYAKEYMATFFSEISDVNCNNLKQCFEQFYWKSPNIITHIQLNFRYLYYKNLKQFNGYIENQKQNLIYKPGKNEEKILHEYKLTKIKYDELISEDSYLYFNKFKNKEIDIKNYDDKKISMLYQQFIHSVDERNHYNIALIKLNNTINEYKNYLQYKFIIDDVKKIYQDKITVSSKLKLKEIFKLEQKLKKINSNSNFFKIFNNKNIDVNKLIEELKDLYSESDNIIFKEKVMELIKEDSKPIDLLSIASSFYIYLVNCYKNEFPDITDDEINLNAKDINEFLLSPYHTLITNLNAFSEYNIAMIISDKYKLDNLNIAIDMLSVNNLDNILEQTNLIITHYKLNALKKLTIKDIEDYCKIDKVITSILEK